MNLSRQEPRSDDSAVACIITVGMSKGPIMTKRQAGETILESIRRHRTELLASAPAGDKLMTTWQIPGGQEVVTTTRMHGESDEAIRERHVSAFTRH